MISDKTLMRLSLLMVLAGIAGIIAVAQFSEPPLLAISEITDDMLGWNVVVEGNVESVSEKDGHYFFAVADESDSIKVVLFSSQAKKQDVNFSKGDSVSVEGKVQLYRDEMEIIASSIKSLPPTNQE